MDQCEYVLCAGGGTHGVMYIGMYRALQDHLLTATGHNLDQHLHRMRGFGGTSVGALTSLAMLLNLSAECLEVTCAPYLSNMRNVVPRPDLTMLFTEFGLDDGTALRDLICQILRAGGICEDATFADIHRLLQRDYVCVATDVQTKKPLYFCMERTPTLRIADAVFMSMCVPFVFAPFRYDKRLVVDGALSHNMPRVFPIEKTLFVDLRVPDVAMRVTNINEYLMAIFAMTVDKSDWYREHMCLPLQLPEFIGSDSSIDFDVHPAVTQMRIRCGYASTLAYLFPDFMPTMLAILELAYSLALESQQQLWALVDDTESCSCSEFAVAIDRCT